MCVNCNDSLQVNLPVGPSGTNGTNGNTILSGTANPPANTLGVNGDYYLNTVTKTLFGPKTGGAWPTPGTSLVGPAGPTGSTGSIGPQGPLGPFGGVTFEYTFTGYAPAGDPGAGKLLAVSALSSPLTTTQICISHIPVNIPAGGNIGQMFSYMSLHNTSTFKGVIKIFKKSDPSAFGLFGIGTIAVNANYTILTMPAPPSAFIGVGSGLVSPGDTILVSFEVTGDKGDPGNYIVTTTEAPGANCALGGVKVELKNGSTSATISTQYVCTQDNIAPGMIMWFANTTAPTGYLACNGQQVSQATYSNLYTAIGSTWDTFNGASAPSSGNFRVPDLQGFFIRGAGTSALDPDSPRSVSSFQAEALSDHTHDYVNYPNQNGPQGSLSSGSDATLNDVASSQVTGYVNGANSNVETRPVNVALLPCIKY